MADQENSPFGVLPKITTRGDIAAAALGLAVGFFVDSMFKPFGIKPETASIYAAAAVLGIKNALQAALEWHRTAEPLETTDNINHGLEKTAERIIEVFRQLGRNADPDDAGVQADIEVATRIIEIVETNTDLWRLGVIDEEEFRKVLRAAAESPSFRVARGRASHMPRTGQMPRIRQ
jgi:hypothetical protein